MKKILIFSFLATLILVSCRKSDNPKLPELKQVSIPKITLDPTSDKFINASNPALFKAVLIVDSYFKEDKPQKYDLVVKKTRGTTTALKTIQTDITTYPTTITVTGQQLIDMFGQSIQGGDMFDFGADVFMSGQKYEAFPATGNPYGSGVANLPGGSTSISFIAPCSFNADTYVGDFQVLSDEWGDYAAGTVIPVKKVSATQLSFQYAVDPASAKPIILNVNPSDNTISVTRQEYGAYSAYGISSIFAEGVAGAASAVNPCDQTLSVRLKHTDASGANYGSYTIRLKKKV